MDAFNTEMRTLLRGVLGRDPMELDERTADRMLNGEMPSDDAPPRYREVTRALGALRHPATERELAGEERAVTAILHGLATSPAPEPGSPVPGSHRVPPRRLVRMVAVGVIVGVGLTGGLATANALPRVAQGVVADVLDAVGVHVPQPDASVGGDDGARDESVPHRDTRERDGSAEPAPGSSPTAGKGDQISDLATTEHSSGLDKGAEVSGQASDGKSRAGEHSPPSTGVPDHAPPPWAPAGGLPGTAPSGDTGPGAEGPAVPGSQADEHKPPGVGNPEPGPGRRP